MVSQRPAGIEFKTPVRSRLPGIYRATSVYIKIFCFPNELQKVVQKHPQKRSLQP